MPAILKVLLVTLARKYAAELLYNLMLRALEYGASKTEIDIDDQLVAALKKEKTFIVDQINKGVQE